jgi:hypothetical protein
MKPGVLLCLVLATTSLSACAFHKAAETSCSLIDPDRNARRRCWDEVNQRSPDEANRQQAIEDTLRHSAEAMEAARKKDQPAPHFASYRP